MKGRIAEHAANHCDVVIVGEKQIAAPGSRSASIIVVAMEAQVTNRAPYRPNSGSGTLAILLNRRQRPEICEGDKANDAVLYKRL